MSLSSWGLPECVLQSYKRSGIEKMFQWQQECLFTGKVLEGGIENTISYSGWETEIFTSSFP